MKNKPQSLTQTYQVLFLYEGDTEKYFYEKVFELIGINRKVPIKKKNLKGNFNLNQKVADKIYDFLINSSEAKTDCQLVVFVAYDREAPKNKQKSRIDPRLIINTIKDKRLFRIHEIIATQMLESWFFIDIEGIYQFLNVPENKQTTHKFKNYENFRHEDLDKMFRQFNQKGGYKKGDKCEELINKLDLKKIYANCPELKTGMEELRSYSEF